MAETNGWAAHDSLGKITPFTFQRRENGDEDVTVKILFCGICHSDVHLARNEWNKTNYPVVPGHEMTGEITEVGTEVKDFQKGDRVGVGNLAMTCRKCDLCLSNQENYCDYITYTYNSELPDGSFTRGGYSQNIVIDYRYVVRIPDKLPLDVAAPLMCAGVAVFRSLKDHNFEENSEKKIGVVGLGGLGHMAVKFAKYLGYHVTVISTTKSKEEDAIEHLGADAFILNTEENLQEARKTLDFIISTISAQQDQDLGSILGLLKFKGTVSLVGEPPEPYTFYSSDLIFDKRSMIGSVIGSIKETQEMLNLCAENDIFCDIEVISPDNINEAFDRIVEKDVRYRFVIDIGSDTSATEVSNL